MKGEGVRAIREDSGFRVKCGEVVVSFLEEGQDPTVNEFSSANF